MFVVTFISNEPTMLYWVLIEKGNERDIQTQMGGGESEPVVGSARKASSHLSDVSALSQCGQQNAFATGVIPMSCVSLHSCLPDPDSMFG